ncbi:MAG: hypothetical protein E7048_00590 [Lentisphaerae bacterium]|nr:hypothetical protein [Lentisphaerota bacterium]
MLKRSLLLLFVLLTLPIAAAPKGNSSPKFAPPPIVMNVSQERPQVAETGEFSSLPIALSQQSKVKLSASSAAALLTEKGKQFSWKPSPRLSSTIRNADLTGAVLSADGTLVVISERIGGEEKPNSTRFILFNVPNRTIAGGFVIKEALIDTISFVPGSKTELIGIRRSSTHFGTKGALVRLNLSHREIMDYVESPAREFTSYAWGANGKIFCTTTDSGEILAYDPDNLSGTPKRIKSHLSSPKVCAAGKDMIAYGTEGIEILRNGQENKKETANFFKAPERFSCLKATVVDPRLPAVIFSGNFEEDCWYFIGNTCKKLKSRVSGVQSWDSLNKLLFIELAANAKVAIFQMPEARENAKPAAPNRLKPANRNHSFALLSVPALKNNMVQIDNRGNVFLLDYSKMGRWKKYSVYVADQAGFRN